jgi:hypothetical protein
MQILSGYSKYPYSDFETENCPAIFDKIYHSLKVKLKESICIL